VTADFRFTGAALDSELKYCEPMDPANPIVQLCVEGMALEQQAKFEEASTLFMQAWERSTCDFERCIAAHYVARHQPNPVDTLLWNKESLKFANAVGDDRAHGFYPSLYLNLGKAYEDLNRAADACRFYQLAADGLVSLGASPYREMVRDGIERALQRVGPQLTSNRELI
jgi:hypothetical protein